MVAAEGQLDNKNGWSLMETTTTVHTFNIEAFTDSDPHSPTSDNKQNPTDSSEHTECR